jgi:hypothetical protein
MTVHRAVLLILGLSVASPALAGPGARVVSRSGALGPPPALAGEVQVGAGETLQLLLPGGGSVAGVCGPARLRVGAGADLALLSGAGPLLLSGAGGRLLLPRGSVQLDPAGAAVLLHGHRLYVLRGRARVAWAAGAGVAAPASQPVARTLQAGSYVELDPSGALAVAAGSPAPALLTRARNHGAPPPWNPGGVDRVTVEDVKRARQRTREERQAAREAASCGCTEGSGQGVDQTGGRDRTTTMEQFKARLRVRISGLPARGR